MSNDPSDSDLLKAYLGKGDQAAFARLVERHLPMVYSVGFRHLQDPGLAQDVVQNVFITLAKRALWLTGHSSLAGWLYRTAVHLALHESRSEQRRRQREQAAALLGTCMKMDDSPLANLAPVLDEVMLELRAADREALLLRYFGNKSLRDLGVHLGIKEDAAQKRVAKALDSLAERLRRRGFKVAGAAALGLALQQATANALPAGLAAVTTQAALAAGATASLGALTPSLLKAMSLTKIQTAALCVAFAALPLGYQWNAMARAQSAQKHLNEQLQALRTGVFEQEQSRSRLEYQVGLLQNQLAAPPPSTAATAPSGPASKDPGMFPWDESSPYVRLPRQVLSQVRFAPFATRQGRDGKVERYQLPPLSADGTPNPALEAALGLTEQETQRLSEICQNELAEFYRLAATHSEMKEEAFGRDGIPSVRLKTAAFAEEGAQFRAGFEARIVDLLGPERAAAFWAQIAPMVTGVFNDYGAYPRELQLIDNPHAGPELMNAYHDGSNIGPLWQRNGMPLPPMLQAYVDAWSQPQPAGVSQTQPSNP